MMHCQQHPKAGSAFEEGGAASETGHYQQPVSQPIDQQVYWKGTLHFTFHTVCVKLSVRACVRVRACYAAFTLLHRIENQLEGRR